MTNPGPAMRSRRGGRLWLVAAVATLPVPLLFVVAVQQHHRWHSCVAGYASLVTTTQGPCAAAYSWMMLAALGFWAAALAAAITAMVAGVVHGRNRRRRRPHGGWQQAMQLYAALASGQPPRAVFAPDLPNVGTVYMDVPLRYSRLYAMDVAYQPGSMVAIGSPGFVAGAAVSRLIGTSIGHLHAANLSRRQWRGHCPARVVLTATATWCAVGGRWLRFDHTTVMEYRLDAGQTSILTFPDVVPMRLQGPSAWCHAVLFAYLRYGPTAWQSAPFLHPLLQAAQQPS